MVDGDQFSRALRDWIGISMRRSMSDLLLYVRENGLSMSQLGALMLIHRKGGCGVSELGDHVGITSAAASQMLERLVHQGIVVRSEDPHDRRVRQIALTEKGDRVLEDSIRARQAWSEELARQLTPEERDQVVAALTLLIERSRRLDTVPSGVSPTES